jgi:hypothetical protein
MMEEMLEFMNNQSLRKRCEPLDTPRSEYIQEWETDYEVMTHQTRLEYFLAAGKNRKALVHLRAIVELATPSDPTHRQEWIDRHDHDPSRKDEALHKRTARAFAWMNACIAMMNGEEERALAYMRVHFGITSRMIGQYSKKFAEKD